MPDPTISEQKRAAALSTEQALDARMLAGAIALDALQPEVVVPPHTKATRHRADDARHDRLRFGPAARALQLAHAESDERQSAGQQDHKHHIPAPHARLDVLG